MRDISEYMVQRLNFGNLGATGIIGVLFIIGIILIVTGIAASLGYLAITAAVLIGIIYAGLGALGIMKRQGLRF